MRKPLRIIPPQHCVHPSSSPQLNQRLRNRTPGVRIRLQRTKKQRFYLLKLNLFLHRVHNFLHDQGIPPLIPRTCKIRYHA
jgi:hypothetical protein